MSLTIWCNAKFNDAVTRQLTEGTRAHRLIFSSHASANVLMAGATDPELGKADIAFGQPVADECLRFQKLRWVEVTTAGYTRYDTPEFLEAFRARGAAFTNASGVFADPCAQHVMAMMLALGRSLLPSYRDQLTDHSWQYEERRYHARLLTGQTVVMLGFGAIGRRLAELLAPFGMKLYAVRRSVRSEAGVHVIPEEKISAVLPLADHVVNILPDNAGTLNYVNARRLACFKPGRDLLQHRARHHGGPARAARGAEFRPARCRVSRCVRSRAAPAGTPAVDCAALLRYAAHGGRPGGPGRGDRPAFPEQSRGV